LLIQYVQKLKTYGEMDRVLGYIKKLMKVGKIELLDPRKVDVTGNPFISKFLSFDKTKFHLLFKILLIFVDNHVENIYNLYI
jgi:hypothetical protein